MVEFDKQLSEMDVSTVFGGKTDSFGEVIVDGGPLHKKAADRKPGEYFQDGDWMCYKIAEGDTLEKISHKFGVSVPRLQYLNQNTIQKTRLIYTGDVIRIRSVNG